MNCSTCGDPQCQVKVTKKGHLMTYCEMCRTQQFSRDKKADDIIRSRMRPENNARDPNQENKEAAPLKALTPAPKEKTFGEEIFGS